LLVESAILRLSFIRSLGTALAFRRAMKMKTIATCASGLALALHVGCASPPDAAHEPPTSNVSEQVSTPPSSTDYYHIVHDNDGPVGYWRLGEPAGAVQAQDAMGINPGTYTGSYPDTPQSIADTPGALVADRDGARTFFVSNSTTHFPVTQSNFVVIPSNANQAPTQTALSLECWLTLPPIPATNSSPVVKTSGLLSDGYGFYFTTHTLYFYVNSLNNHAGATFLPGPNGASDNDTPQSRYHHVVGTYDGHYIRMYMDGVLTQQNGMSGPINAGPGPLVIGKGYVLVGWQGKIDEVALYNKVLSLQQVQDHYRAGLAATPIDQATPASNLHLTSYYGGNIVVPTYTYAPSSTLLAWTAQMQSTLGAITGVPFTVNCNGGADAGGCQPSESIQLIRTQGYPNPSPMESALIADLNTRGIEAFAALSDPSSPTLKFFSRSETGLELAMKFYQRLLGYRWLLPGCPGGNCPPEGNHWIITPNRASIRWNVARVEEPEMKVRTTADYRSAKAGSIPMDPTSSIPNTWAGWEQFNMLGSSIGGHDLGGQIGAAFNVRNIGSMRDPNTGLDTNKFRAEAPDGTPVTWNPLWEPGAGAKAGVFGWHFAFPNFESFFANDRVSQLKVTSLGNCAPTFDRYTPDAVSISAEEADGVEDNSPEAIAYGTASDNVVRLGNAAANALTNDPCTKGASASILGYNTHMLPPTTVGAPNLIAGVDSSYFNRTGLTDAQLIAAWKAKVPTVFHYRLLYDTTELSLPPGGYVNFFDLGPSDLRTMRDAGSVGLRAQSMPVAATTGFFWDFMSQLLYNTRIVDSLWRDDLFTEAFGPAAGPMADMIQRWAESPGVSNQELAVDVFDLNLAISATNDPVILNRLNDFASYVHYLSLYNQYTIAKSAGAAQRHAAANALLAWVWGTYYSNMVDAYRIGWLIEGMESTDTVLLNAWDFLPSSGINLTSQPGTNFGCQLLGGRYFCSGYPQVTASAITAALASDTQAYPTANYPPDPPYSPTLTPCSTVSPACPSAGTDTTNMYTPWTSISNTYAFTATAGQSVSFTVVEDLNPYSNPRFAHDAIPFVINDPSGTQVLTQNVPCVAGDAGYCVGSAAFALTAKSAGTYTVQVFDAGGLDYHFLVPHNLPFALTGSYDNPFGGVYRGDAADYEGMYFYVPEGTTKFIVHNAFQDGPDTFNLFDATGNPATGTPQFVATGASTIIPVCTVGGTAACPHKQSGTIWTFNNFKGSGVWFELIPNMFSPSREQVLVPTGVK
jgi:hypothetical protein